MPRKYSLYEAKAKLSSLIKQVREGESLVITVHGEPVAELRPYSAAGEPQSLEDRIAELRARGMIVSGATPDRRGLRPVKRVRGALKRFLEERD